MTTNLRGYVFTVLMLSALAICVLPAFGDPIHLSVQPCGDIYICVGVTVELNLTTYDIDRAEGTTEVKCDGLDFQNTWPPSGWAADPPQYGDCALTQRCTKTFDQPGVYSYTITADDLNTYGWENDPPATPVTVTIHVCALSLSSARSWIEYGCGEVSTSSFVTCVLGDGCLDVEPSWETTGPLWIEYHGKVADRRYVAKVHSLAPQGCQETGTVTAVLSGCTSNTVSIIVKKLGPFSITRTGTDPTIYHNGEHTFAELGHQPPYGCDYNDPVFGPETVVNYTFCSACPLPRPITFREELACGFLCDCPPADPADFLIPEGFSGCTGISDSFGLLLCSCDDPRFAGYYHFRIMQRYVLGEKEGPVCELAQICVEVTRDNEFTSCTTVTQSVTATDGWEFCSCSYP